MDRRSPWAASVVEHDGVIVQVGSEADARPYLRPDTVEVDLRGGFLMPGFIDGHDHLVGGALAKVGVSLEGLHGKEAVLEQIRRYAVDHPGHEVIRGHGWTPFTFDGTQPHRTWLDSVTDVRPAFLHTYDVHDVWANTAAFVAAGIGADTPDPNPPTAFWPRDPDGFPSGTCCEPESWLPIAIRLGITSYFDASTMLTSRRQVSEVYRHLVELDMAGELPVRVVGSHVVRDPSTDPRRAVEALRAMNEEFRSAHVSVSTVKMFMDGVGPQHTAAMLEPYADQPHRGGWVCPPDFVRSVSEAVNLAGFDVHIHACGDAGVRGALDGFEYVRRTHPGLAPRNTVCHLEFCHPDDVLRFAELGVTANCTPVWGTDYRGEFVDAYPGLVGAERFHRDYCPYGSVVRSGANVTFGADCPGVEVHEIAPLVQIESAVTRQRPGRPDDRPAGAHERVSVAEALRCYTANGAWALRLEDVVGSIEVGKHADLVVLGVSPFDVRPHEIHSIPVVHTMLGGRFTHGATA
jgi:predicted amidohydrolase YtcJ